MSLPHFTFAGTLLAVLIAAFPGATQALAFNTQAPTLLAWPACHFLHWNAEHLFWSGGAFLVLGALCERAAFYQFRRAVLGALFAIPVGLTVFNAPTPLYAGLSGVDSALFVVFAVNFIRGQRRRNDTLLAAGGFLMLFGFAGKIAYESLFHAAVFANTPQDFLPVPLAHLIGGVVGLLSSLRPHALESRETPQPELAP